MPAIWTPLGRDGRFPGWSASGAIGGVVGAMVSLGAYAQPIVPPPTPVFEDPLPAPKESPPEGATVGPLEDGPSYPFDVLVIEYGEGYPRPVPVEELVASTRIEVRIEGATIGVPREGEPRESVALAALTAPASADGGMRNISAGAINEVCRALVAEMNRRGSIGVQVTPDPAQLDLRTMADQRRADQDATIRILVLPAWVGEVTVKSVREDRPGSEPEVAPRLSWIAEESPVQPGADGATPGDALNREAVEDYVRWVSRHPRRRADASISPMGESGDVSLEYLVTESKPWSFLAQLSNTGTENTGELRERFSFTHTQLTGHDDILALDFITAEFQDTNAFLGSYEAPVFGARRVRWRVFGNWQQYVASDLGFGNENFSGDGYTVGGDLIGNIYQRRELFIDLVGGARFEWQEVENGVAGTDGDAGFFVPYIGLDLERIGSTSATRGGARVEWSLSNLLGGGDENLDVLGRPNTDSDWVVLKYDASHSVYLEPLFEGASWFDPDAPGSHTLAHEVSMSMRGQYAFGYRLSPQAQSIVGGLYTVRGYPEAATAGDSTVIASLEYRFHLPRALGIEPDPTKTKLLGKPFRVAPDRPFGMPDWDLVFSAFIDAGWSFNSDRESFEHNDTLVGTGVGMELVLRQNLGVRVDWGIVLEEIPGVSAGSNRVNFVVTIQF